MTKKPRSNVDLVKTLEDIITLQEEYTRQERSEFDLAEKETSIDKASSFVDEFTAEKKKALIEKALSYEDIPLAPELLLYPYRFNFYQAILIFLWLSERAGWAQRLRFRSSHSLKFPSSELTDISIPFSRDMPVEMTVTFLGLVSHGSILPTPYLEYMIEDQYHDDGALLDFIDIINDRIISLLVKSKLRRKLSLSLQIQNIPPITRFLSALTGPGTPAGLTPNNRIATLQELVHSTQIKEKTIWPSLLYLSSLLTRHTPSKTSLERLLSAYTGMPVSVQEFQGQCRRLSPQQRTVMGRNGINTRLGISFTLGHQVWLADAGMNIVFEVYKKPEGMIWVKDQSLLSNLKQLVMFHLGNQAMTFDFSFILGGEQLTPFRLWSDPAKLKYPTRLGLSSVLFSSKPPERVTGRLSYPHIRSMP